MAQISSESIDVAVAPFFPAGFLKVVGFLIPADETTAELIDWYENIHSRNARFLWPHLDLYRRNYIMAVETGPIPPYRVVTEFVWKSEQDKQAARAAFASPAAEPSLNEQLPSWIKPLTIPNTNALVPAEPTIIATPSVPHDSQTALRRRVILLDQKRNVPQTDFDAETQGFAKAIAKRSSGSAVHFDLCRHITAWPATRAIVYVNDDANGDLPPVDSRILEIANIFRVETRKSPL